jgi:hypothetical protein
MLEVVYISEMSLKSVRLHFIISHKAVIFILAAVRIINLISSRNAVSHFSR